MSEIGYSRCPDCGAELYEMKQWGKHVNGHWNETRTFTCGAIHAYSPNFNRIEVRTPCSNLAETVLAKEKRSQALHKLVSYVRTLDVDAAFKNVVEKTLSETWRLK